MAELKGNKEVTIYSPNLLILKKTGIAQDSNGDIRKELKLSLEQVISESPIYESSKNPEISANSANKSCMHIFLPKTPEDVELIKEDLDITVKLFFLDPNSSPESSYIEEALASTLKWLDVKRIDLLVLTFHGLLLQDDSEETQYKLDNAQVNIVWKAMEEQYKCGKVTDLGVCEFSKSMLQSLLSEASIKPSVNQVNLSDCCVIPKSLREYAKAEDIKLFTHNDPNDLISSSDFNSLLSNSIEASAFQPKWASRYSINYKSRGIVASQGYIIHAKMP